MPTDQILDETQLIKGIGVLSVGEINNGFYLIRLTNGKNFTTVKKVTIVH